MKLKITFEVLQKGQLLPLSYQYELSAWCYKMIHKNDSAFAQFLHEKGYFLGNKTFKLFTFSRLYVPQYEIIDDRMKIQSNEISFMVSFFAHEAAEHMAISLFAEEYLRLGDRITQVDLRVKAVEILHLAIPSTKVRLKTTSPIVVGKPRVRADGKLTDTYLHPNDVDFEHYFVQNLIRKYQVAKEYQLIEATNTDFPIRLNVLSKQPKLQGVRLKAHTAAESKVKGYAFEFELSAPQELIKLGMLAGFGGKNAQGFGATRLARD